MLNCGQFYNLLRENGIDFFAGVPDTLLKDFCAFVAGNVAPDKNIITANEGGAVALAAGYHLATGKIGLVYLQNSGEGNAINPLTSLVDPEVFSIPILVMIGWRGEPGQKDEPQHIKQGRITLNLLDALEIPYEILPDDFEMTRKSIEKATRYMREEDAPFALIARKGTFEPYEFPRTPTVNPSRLLREAVIKLVTDSLETDDIVVSTTGMTSRELFEYREKTGGGHGKDFLTVGSMGHSSQIALGIALSKPARQVYCLDGDGSVIMHMGALAIIGSQKPENFKHIVINNGAHESVGGQPTAGFTIDIPAVAKACGYNLALTTETAEDIKNKMKLLKEAKGPALLEVKVNIGHRPDLGRPTISPQENKKAFMKFLEG